MQAKHAFLLGVGLGITVTALGLAPVYAPVGVIHVLVLTVGVVIFSFGVTPPLIQRLETWRSRS